MTSHRRIRARNAGLDKVRRVTMRVAGGGLILSGGIAALASATYGGTSHHRVIVYGSTRVASPRVLQPSNGAAPLTDPTLPPTTAPSSNANSNGGSTGTNAPVQTAPPTTSAPITAPQYTPQTLPPYTPPVVVSGGS